MVEAPCEDRTGAIGGIQIVHRLATGIELTEPQVKWPDGNPTRPPLVIDHAVGDASVTDMRHVMDIGMRVSYYARGRSDIAIRIRNLQPSGPVHVVRVVDPGHRYEVNYEFAPTAPAYRRDVEITAFAHALTARGGSLMAHGCGAVLDNGRGVVLLGLSGAGKSTAARMLEAHTNVKVLNDDRVILERASDSFHLWGTPWPGNAGVARSGESPLGAVALIGRGVERSARRLTAREALIRILPTLALPLWDSGLMPSAVEFVHGLLEYLPVVELRYPLTDGTPTWMVEALQDIK